MKKPTKTDLAQIDALTDDRIDTSDVPALTDAFFKHAKWRMPKQDKVKITVEVEPEVIEWFKSQGQNYDRYISAALRIYAEAHQARE